MRPARKRISKKNSPKRKAKQASSRAKKIRLILNIALLIDFFIDILHINNVLFIKNSCFFFLSISFRTRAFSVDGPAWIRYV